MKLTLFHQTYSIEIELVVAFDEAPMCLDHATQYTHIIINLYIA